MQPEWLSALSNLIVALGVVVAARQLTAIRQQTDLQLKEAKADHERSRRELAVRLAAEWAQHSYPGIVHLTHLVTSLNAHQCDALYLGSESIHLDMNQQTILRRLMEVRFPERQIPQNLEVLSPELEDIIRTLVINRLNRLEAIAAAWKHNLADRQILDDEFKSVILGPYNTFDMVDFMHRTGTYPSLRSWGEDLSRKSKQTSHPKPPIF
jgi:hypothetical protein